MARASRLLAFDTAGSSCSAAVWASNRVVAHRFEAMGRGQSERLVPMIQEVMDESAMAYDALDAVAVTLGPGGFTGVRIGLATARGLSLACGIPVLGISSFQAVAAGVGEPERRGRRLVVLLDAKRPELYAQVMTDALAPDGEPACVAPRDLAAWMPDGRLVLAGDAVGQVLDDLSACRGRDLLVSTAPSQARAGQLAALAATLPLPGTAAPPPQPLYLRAPDVTRPKPAGGPR